jgi:sugar lactone lactonase YvrE
MQLNKTSLNFAAVMIFTLFGLSNVEAADKVVSGLRMPESVLVVEGKIFVSEIGEFGKDGDGDVAVIEGDKVKPFATGMDDPKGLAYAKGALYVADKTRILKISKDGQWKVFAAPEAFPVKPQFLNDLAFGDDGLLYVSDSGDLKGKGGAVYQVSADGKVTTIVNSDDPRVLAPNGVLADGKEHILMVDFVSGILYRIKVKTGKMDVVAEGFGGGDGVVRDRQKAVWVSDWKSGRVFRVKPDGEIKLVRDGYQSAADINVSGDGKFILVPDMKAGTLNWLPIGH